jgi:hypothetical protein
MSQKRRVMRALKLTAMAHGTAAITMSGFELRNRDIG